MIAKEFLFLLITTLIEISSPRFTRGQFPEDTCPPNTCIPVEFCSFAMDQLKKGEFPKLCGFFGDQPMTCCLSPSDRTSKDTGPTRISAQMCEEYSKELCPSFVPYIIGGTPAKREEVPFMAHIGYGEKGEESWQCGGSLISTRYVLSAAHCTDANNYGLAKWTRLGDLDTSSNGEDSTEIFEIVMRFNHPQYTTSENYHDIALYRLDREVKFSKLIRPICLQQDNTMDTTKAEVAGWGRVGFIERVSSKLLKVDVDLLEASECSKTASSDQLPRGMDADSMICAGAISGGRDTCLGDSGGPLFSISSHSFCHLRTQFGVTSFGYQCGLAGYPGVYTKVSHYLKWIESIVWPSNSDALTLWSD